MSEESYAIYTVKEALSEAKEYAYTGQHSDRYMYLFVGLVHNHAASNCILNYK
jgi:hypothetical protein